MDAREKIGRTERRDGKDDQAFVHDCQKSLIQKWRIQMKYKFKFRKKISLKQGSCCKAIFEKSRCNSRWTWRCFQSCHALDTGRREQSKRIYSGSFGSISILKDLSLSMIHGGVLWKLNFAGVTDTQIAIDQIFRINCQADNFGLGESVNEDFAKCRRSFSRNQLICSKL